MLNHLTGVSMTRRTMTTPVVDTTQTRTFVYDANQRLYQTTTPESGTTTYGYNPDGSLATRTDAKGQKTAYSYDTYRRLEGIDHYAAGSGTPDPCQKVLMDYDYPLATLKSETVAYRKGRISAVGWGSAANPACAGPGFVEQYAYTQAGQLQDKKLTLTVGGASGYLEAYFQYNGDGRLTLMQGPWQTDPEFYAERDRLIYSYDEMGRPEKME